MLEKNNIEILLNKGCRKYQYRYQIRSAKISCYLFKAVGSYSASRKDEHLNTANYVAVFARLFIACQTREGDLENFFAHENQPNLPFCQIGES